MAGKSTEKIMENKSVEKIMAIKSVEKIMAICKELNLQVKTDLPLEQNTYLSAWHKGTTHI